MLRYLRQLFLWVALIILLSISGGIDNASAHARSSNLRRSCTWWTCPSSNSREVTTTSAGLGGGSYLRCASWDDETWCSLRNAAVMSSRCHGDPKDRGRFCLVVVNLPYLFVFWWAKMNAAIPSILMLASPMWARVGTCFKRRPAGIAALNFPRFPFEYCKLE